MKRLPDDYAETLSANPADANLDLKNVMTPCEDQIETVQAYARACFPKGATVEWLDHDGIYRTGEVTGLSAHCYPPVLVLRNLATKKLRRVDLLLSARVKRLS